MSKFKTEYGILLLTGTVVIAAMDGSFAQIAPSGPRIMTNPEVFDFGYVPQDATVSHTFWLHNPGTETVKIKKLQPNCGCTQAPLTDSSIAVGDSVPVELLFGSRNISGKVEKFTRIFSNAIGRVPALTIRTQMFKENEKPGGIAVSPSIANVGTGTPIKITVQNITKNHLTVRVVDLPPRLIHLDNNEISLAPEEGKNLTITLLSQAAPGEFTKSITLEANDPAKTRITVPVTNVQRE